MMDKPYIQWGVSCLQEKGYDLINSSPENVQSTPWSDVVRFKSISGDVYLKKTPALIYEPSVIYLLHDQFKAPVPEVIARNDDLHCFMMKDAGEHLRVLLKNEFDVALACKAIDTFATLQLSTSNNVDALIAAGVPDWRLENFPNLYRELLSYREILIKDGLSESEIRELKDLESTLNQLCDEILTYNIPQAIVQPDFNDNNSLINSETKKITIIDLGELAISHPFFSMMNWLQVMKRHHLIQEDHKKYGLMLGAYLKHFSSDAIESFNHARPLCHIYGALAEVRLFEACDADEIFAIQRGKLSDTLRRFAKSLL